jgi:transposase
MSTKKNRKLKTNRRYSQTFKQARVDDFENGTFSVAQMSRLYDIRAHVIYRWIHKYSRQPKQTAIIVEVPNSQTEKVKQLEARIAQLERSLGKKQIELDFHKSLLEEIKESGVDISRRDFFSEGSNDSCKNTKD